MQRRFVALVLLAAAACTEPPSSAAGPDFDAAVAFGVVAEEDASSILILQDGVTEEGLRATVEAAGGTLEAFYPFGVAVARMGGADAASIDGVASAVLDTGFDVDWSVAREALAEDLPPNSGDDDFFYDLQWGHNYVGAQAAWDAGQRGQGVRVAVLDGGFDLDHPDLAPNFNYGLSLDLTGEGLQYSLPNTFSHATHVAGTILAADNAFGTIGVAPEAELVGVKVLGDSGNGSFADIIAGIYYATIVDADVINMSLGLLIPRKVDVQGLTELAVALGHATLYARQQGSLVVTSAGNNGADLDGDGGTIRFMNGLPGTIGISAMTTLNWASDPAAAPFVPASYTNYGTSMVDFTAPGGSVDYPGNEGCVVAGLARPCWVFDLVFSTGNGGWYWSGGTSMAAPHASGVAALIIGENGGDMAPALVIREMRRRAVALAKGRTDFFGHGLVNSGY